MQAPPSPGPLSKNSERIKGQSPFLVHEEENAGQEKLLLFAGS
jgi:hypothetical protein